MSLDKKFLLKAVVLIALAFALAGCGGPPHCSAEWLVDAINDANSNGPGLDTIDLASGCVYELGVVDNTIDGNNGLPSITTTITINGHGATVRRSTGAQKAAIRLFHISQGGELVLNDLRLHDGMGMEPPNVTIPLKNDGGAVFNNGTLTVNSCDFDYNRAHNRGGGIYNAGTMTIASTTFQNNAVNIGNEPGESGGAIFNTSTGNATIANSTFVGNIASQSGAAIANAGMMTITNSTISGNSTTLTGIASGAAIMNSGSIQISYTTIAANAGTTSGAVWSAPDTIAISNSIIAGNLPQNCSYPAVSWISGPNLDDDGSCDSFTIIADPQLDPLANNGGPTLTHAIAPSSPAKNAAAGDCPPTDQRGEPRPHGSACDLGAYELSGGPVQQAPAELSGMVFNDLNGDGAWTPGEPPFAGVELALGGGTCPAAGISQTTLAASDGSYQFTLPSPNTGTYCLSIDPLVEPNTSILIPGGFTVPIDGQLEVAITEGQILGGLDFGWMFQFGPNPTGPDLVITNVVLSATTILVNNWLGVEVTVENVGSVTASGYDVVLIPHYGWGPPNPGGFEAIPDLAPGASHTIVFSPGVLYANLGTFTLRVLVTDDWYDLGDPDSTGTAGDYQDFTITVTDTLMGCNPFANLDPSLVILSIREELMILPIYLDTGGVPIPGLGPDDPEPWEYYALLNEIPSNLCSLQGFEDRLYCTFTIPADLPGSVAAYALYLEGCADPVFSEPRILIPELKPVCSEKLGKEACAAAGGTYIDSATRVPYCACP